MYADRVSHVQSNDNLCPVTFKQGPIVSTFKPFPVARRRIGEADPFLAIDNEPDEVGARELCMVLGGFVSLLMDQGAWRWPLVGLWSFRLVATLICWIRLNSLYTLFCVGQIGAL